MAADSKKDAYWSIYIKYMATVLRVRKPNGFHESPLKTVLVTQFGVRIHWTTPSVKIRNFHKLVFNRLLERETAAVFIRFAR